MSTAADISAGDAELRHRQVQESSPDAGSSIGAGPAATMEPLTADKAVQDGGIGKSKKTFGRTPDGTGKRSGINRPNLTGTGPTWN
jgi:phosphatidylethanolamine N-methyltransferase